MSAIPNLSLLGWVHTGFSVLALILGLLVVATFVAKRHGGILVTPFLLMTLASNVTTLPFFSRDFGIAQKFTILGLILVTVAILARYVFKSGGFWRRMEVVALVLSTWLQVFFTINEAFIRVPSLKVLAPTLSEPPFRFSQLTALAAFVLLALLSAVRQRN